MAVFKVAFARWVALTEESSLPDLVVESAGELAAVAAGSGLR